MRATSISPSLATWRSYRRSAECAGARAVNTRTCGIARRSVFEREAGDGESCAITRPCPSTWMGAIALRWISHRSGSHLPRKNPRPRRSPHERDEAIAHAAAIVVVARELGRQQGLFFED